MINRSEITENKERLKKFAHKLCSNPQQAQDLYQTTLLTALEKETQYKEGSNFFGWASKIMYNQFVTNYRRRTKFETQYDPEPYISACARPANQNLKLRLKNVMEAIDKLPEKQKKIMHLVCLEGKSYKVSAERLGIPVGTVRSRLARARKALS